MNFNAPGQIVIAGHREAVERAIESRMAKGAKRGLMLPVSAPFHSSLLSLQPTRLRDYLGELQRRRSDDSGRSQRRCRAARTDADAMRSALAQQAASPVRWVETVQAFVAAGVTHIVECGPGQVLTGLCRRIAPDLSVLSTNDENELDEALRFDAAA